MLNPCGEDINHFTHCGDSPFISGQNGDALTSPRLKIRLGEQVWLELVHAFMI